MLSLGAKKIWYVHLVHVLVFDPARLDVLAQIWTRRLTALRVVLYVDEEWNSSEPNLNSIFWCHDCQAIWPLPNCSCFFILI